MLVNVRTGRVASEMAAAQAQAPAPELEAGLGHALPLIPYVVMSSG